MKQKKRSVNPMTENSPKQSSTKNKDFFKNGDSLKGPLGQHQAH